MNSAVVFEDLDAASAAVRSGGVIAYAAEGVMGLGCDPFQEASVQQVIAIKGRAAEKGLIVLCASVDLARRLVRLDQCDFEGTAGAYWPGPTTLIVPAKGVSAAVTGGRDTVALRVPSFPALLQLVEACGGYLISTSANLSGDRSPQSAGELNGELLDHISGVVPGDVEGLGGATSIIDARSGAVLR